ncbi:MAG: hypothetical protein AAF442_05010 [Pseudomonadota bacterium]
MTQAYKVLTTLRHDHRTYDTGETVRLTDTAAKYPLLAGQIALPEQPAPPAPTKKESKRERT